MHITIQDNIDLLGVILTYKEVAEAQNLSTYLGRAKLFAAFVLKFTSKHIS